MTGEEKKSILAVEDDPQVQEILKRILGEEYEVSVESDGQHALERIQREKPDLILLDLSLLGSLNGLEICRQVRRLKKLDHVAIMILTAHGGDQLQEIGLKLGADDYVLKPFSPEKLKERVAFVFQQRKNKGRL